MANGNLKLAIQSKGRLSEKSLSLIEKCGIDFETFSQRLMISAKNFPIDILFLRDDDIPEYVQDGVADIGIVGKNVVAEKKADVNYEKELGFGKCSLMIASQETETLTSFNDLENKIIATSYPNIVQSYLDDKKVGAKIIELSGSVEIAPSLGIADLICDIVSTGNTLRKNKLKKSFSIFESEAVLISNKKMNINPGKEYLLKRILLRINSALKAKYSKYLMLNVPTINKNKILELIPSLKSPTVLNLADESMVSVHAVIHADQFWKIVDRLKEEGATDILLLPIENIIL